MKFLRLRILTLATATLLVIGASGYPVDAVTAAKKEHSAHSDKPARFHYVCPMHEDVTSRKSGLCRKCKMKLVKTPLPQRPRG
jgi:hypothetical protein